MQWLSAQGIAEAAAAGLMPGLPTSKRGVNALASREGWAESGHCRQSAGAVGGGLEYHIDLLPASARAAWLGHHLTVAARDLRPVLTDGPADDGAEARGVLLRLAARFQAENGLPQTAADALFCEMYTAGSIALPAWIEGAVKGMSPRSLARWRRALAAGGAAAGRGRPKGSGILDRAQGGRVKAFVLAALVKHPFAAAKHLRAMVRAEFGDRLDGAPVPSVRMFQIALARWKKLHRNELMKITDPDRHRSSVGFVLTGTMTAERLNEVWQIDASPADVMLHGGRHSIYMAVDVYSRRSIVLVSKTPRAAAVGLLIRKCILEWGVPERIKTDNGSDFVAHQIKRLFAALEIAVELSPAYQPQTKGIVERTIGTFQRDLAVLPGFVGHSVADRKVIENRRAFHDRLGASDDKTFGVDMDFGAFQEWCDAWAAQIYGQDSHAALSGRTPFAVAASWAGPVRRIEHEAALDVLLAPIASGGGIRQVTKQGVRVEGVAYLPSAVLPGTSVLVRMDPADAGRIMLFDPETEAFLGEAVNAQLAGIDRVELLAKTRAMQKAYETEALVDIRREGRRIKSRQGADALRRDAAARAGALVAFPRPSERHETPALAAAREAVLPTNTPAVAPRAPEASQVSDDAHAAFVAAHRASAEIIAKPESPKERFRRHLIVEQRLGRGDPVSEDERAALTAYQRLPEYLGHKRIFEDFGQAMFG